MIKGSNNALVVDFVKLTTTCQKPCLLGLSAVILILSFLVQHF